MTYNEANAAIMAQTRDNFHGLIHEIDDEDSGLVGFLDVRCVSLLSYRVGYCVDVLIKGRVVDSVFYDIIDAEDSIPYLISLLCRGYDKLQKKYAECSGVQFVSYAVTGNDVYIPIVEED